MRPAIESAIPTSGEVRASAGPAARTLPSCERRVARMAGALTRVRRSPARSSGNTRRGVQSTRSPETGTRRSPRRLPNTRVSTTTGTVTSLPSRRLGVARLEAVIVAVAAARRYARRKRSTGKRALASSLSRSCIARSRRAPRRRRSRPPRARSADRVLDPTIPPATSDTAASPRAQGARGGSGAVGARRGCSSREGGPCWGDRARWYPRQ